MNKNVRDFLIGFSIVLLIGSIILIFVVFMIREFDILGNEIEESTELNQKINNSTTTTKTTTTKPSIEEQKEYKASCKTYKYKTIARNPNEYIFERAMFTGKVVQTMYDGKEVGLRVNVTKDKWGYYDDTIYVSYTLSDGEPKILEDDIIDVYGLLMGEISYESVLGSTITIPSMQAKYIDIKE